LTSKFDAWLIIGFTGQILFSLRFLVQWLASEKEKKSVIPISFWYFSLGGSFLLLSYALHRQDPVFILGQSMGFFIYIRNLALIKKEKVAEKVPENENQETN
jgi:lipid-A-disaccharide synthase-like uncharacterized protein